MQQQSLLWPHTNWLINCGQNSTEMLTLNAHWLHPVLVFTCNCLDEQLHINSSGSLPLICTEYISYSQRWRLQLLACHVCHSIYNCQQESPVTYRWLHIMNSCVNVGYICFLCQFWTALQKYRTTNLLIEACWTLQKCFIGKCFIQKVLSHILKLLSTKHY